MYLIGTTLLVMGIAMAALACVSYILVARGNQAALPYGRAGVYGMLAAVVGAWLLLMVLFLTRRFDFAYVTNYSSSDLDTFFTIAAIWAGQPGSFAIWVLWSVIISAVLVGQSRHFEPYIQAVMAFAIGWMLLFTVILNPFRPLFDPQTGLVLSPPDGNGLNPLLHNFWMIIHPPILFVGFALAIVPFAFAVGALLRRDYDSWVTRALPWTLGAWVFLGLALLLGGYWAYETLGWGGYWGWDPVENSSLVPWLLLTALLHGMLVQRSHGSLRRTNIVLAMLSYLAVFYSTFLTRSGVLANLSVHTFVAEGIQGWMLAFLLLVIAGCVGVLALRWRDIPGKPLSDKFFSLDNFFVLGMLTLGIIAAVVAIGTSMPVISMIPGLGHWLQGMLGSMFELDDGTMFGGEPLTDGRFNVATSFYTTTVPPLGIVTVVLLIIAPLLGWRDSNLHHMLRSLAWPGMIAVIATCIALLLGVRDLLPLAYVGLSVFAAGVNIMMLTRTMRGGWLRIGGYLSHIGVFIMLIGFVGSSVYASPDERLMLSADEPVSYQDYTFTFNGREMTEDGGGVLDLTVQRGEETFSAQPELYFDPNMGSTVQNPHIQSYIWEDLYIAPAEYVPEFDPRSPIMRQGTGIEVGPYQINFDEFDVDTEAMMSGSGEPDMGAQLSVTYEGETTTVIPRMQLMVDPETDQPMLDSLDPVALPGGDTVELIAFLPDMGIIMLRTAGENIDSLPVSPAQAVITASTKPLVVLVWVGFIVSVLGGTIALVRRYLEGQSRVSGQRAHLPRGLGKLPGLGGKVGWRGGGAAR